MSKQYVLTDGRRFLALDYKYEDYHVTENVWSAYFESTKKELVNTRRMMRQYQPELYKSIKKFKIKQVSIQVWS